MPTYTVKKGDTMWALASRSLQSRLGRKPTNAEINRAVKNARVPGSGDKNKIKPGDKITFSYTAGGGSEARGAEGSNRKQTTRERMRDIERAPKKKASAGARAAGAADRYGSGGKPGKKAATTSSSRNVTNMSPRGGSPRREMPKSRGSAGIKQAPRGTSKRRVIKKRTQTAAQRVAARRGRYPGA